MANTVHNLRCSQIRCAGSPWRSEITLETEIASNDVTGKQIYNVKTSPRTMSNYGQVLMG